MRKKDTETGEYYNETIHRHYDSGIGVRILTYDNEVSGTIP
jgi:hypothetical protein